MIRAEFVMSLGRDDFLQQMMRSLEDVLRVDHVTLFIFDYDFIPHFITGVSQGEAGLTSKLGLLYEKSRYYHHDPNVKSIGLGEENSGAPLVQQLHAKDIAHSSYRKNIYEDHNLLDRLSIIDHHDRKWFTLNLYRENQSGYFSTAETDLINSHAALLAAFVKQHLSLSPPQDWEGNKPPSIGRLENIVANLGGELSKREVEVCARAMQGLTREAVSLDLGLKQPTVATFMRRAYSKLNISSLNELFALCLAKTNVVPD